MRGSTDVCGCFPTGRHYPGIADRLERVIAHVEGLCEDFEPAGNWRELSVVVIDFETTGLDPEQDRIVEIGLAAFDGEVLTELKNVLVNPQIPVPEESRKVHGITDEELAEAPAFAEALAEVEPLLRGRLPVAYNATFDRRFLHAECARLGSEARRLAPALQDGVIWVDPLIWVRELHRYEESRKLSDVCARLGVALDNAHRAASDAEATGRVLLQLAAQMPGTYSELIRLQGVYAARQDAEYVPRRGRRLF